jgi:hypothetical protein
LFFALVITCLLRGVVLCCAANVRMGAGSGARP